MPAKRAYALGDFDPTTRSIPVIASTPNAVEGEALESWDLSRFEKNPVVLWSHRNDEFPLGRAEEIKQGPEGLSMRIFLAPEKANPKVGYIEHLLLGKFLRGVSVGYEPGFSREDVIDGQKVTVRRANELLEVSFVSVPADEDAGTGALHADAGAVRIGEVIHSDAAMSKVEWTAWGTARIKTNICRVGVLDYPGRRELRPPEEVFRADSIATLRGVPVVDIADHTDFVRPADFRKKALGFVEDARQEGDFIVGTLHVHDGESLERIRRGERLDVSAGYFAPTVKQAGTWRGEAYDHVQRGIIYNHVALCPPGRGRAGAEVGLKLDVRDVGNGAGSTRTPRVTSAESRVPRA